MARTFNGTNQSIDLSATSLNAGTGCSVSAWVFSTGGGVVMCAEANNGFNFKHGSNGKLTLDQHGVLQLGQSTGSVTDNAWTHIGFKFNNSGGIRFSFYINGALSGGPISAGAGLGSDPYQLGRNPDGGGSEWYNGRIAEIGVWTTELTDADFAMLGLGFSPRLVKPTLLWDHFPLVRDLIGEKLGGLTNNGTTVGNHCRIINVRKGA